MASVLVPDTIEVEVLMSLDGQDVENTLWFEHTSSWDATTMLAMCHDLITWWDTYGNPLSSALVLRAVKATDWTSLDGAQVQEAPGSLFQGGQTSSACAPSNVAACISFRTAKRGRNNRGRNYITGIPLGVIDSNDISEAFASLLVASYTQLIGIAADHDCTWVVASRYSGVSLVNGKKKPTPRAVGVVEPIVNVAFTDLTVDSQRGRLPRH